MILHNNIRFYTCTDIANAMNDELPEFDKVKMQFCKIYKKQNNFYFTQSYIQSKLYPAMKCNKIAFLSYATGPKRQKRNAFSVADLLEYLNKQDAEFITQQIFDPIYNEVKL